MAVRIVAAVYLASAMLRNFRHSCSGRPPSLPAALLIARLNSTSMRGSSVHVCVSVGVSCLGAGGTATRKLSLRIKCSSPQALPNQQRSLPLMICFFDWDPCVFEHLAQINSIPNREPCAHSSTSSAVSSGQLSSRRPCALRQIDILMMLNIVYAGS